MRIRDEGSSGFDAASEITVFVSFQGQSATASQSTRDGPQYPYYFDVKERSARAGCGRRHLKNASFTLGWLRAIYFLKVVTKR
jgi:hypothetical protein